MNLLLFLSDRCNMSCDYCFLDLNEGPARLLDPEAARRALSEVLARRAGKEARVTVLGGEPLVHASLLRRTLEGLRDLAGGGVRATVVTNGTLLCPAVLSELRGLGAEVTVSLDGRPAAHDRHRRLVSGGGSALEETLRALEGADLRGLSANMVVGPDTAPALAGNLAFLRELGLARLSFHLDVAADWDEAAREGLREGLEGALRLSRLLPERDGPGLELTHLEAVVGRGGPEPAGDHPYEDLVLGPDGAYYPCDALLSLPAAELPRWRVGDAFGGVDWAGRERFHGRAREAIHRALAGAGHYTCPRETYFLALARGRDPARAVRGYHLADTLLGEALSRVRDAGRDHAAAR